MKLKNGSQLGALGAGIVCSLAGSALGFGGERTATGTLDEFINSLDRQSAIVLGETEAPPSPVTSLGWSLGLKGTPPAESFGVLLDRAMPMPGMFGPSTGLSIKQAIEHEGFERVRRERAAREKARAYKERAFHLDATPRNYRGRRIDHAAPVRYVEDFEDGAYGQEWSLSSKLTDGNIHSQFLGPVRNGEQVLYVRVDPGEAYTLKFDLYLIGVPTKDYDPDAEIKVLVDGVPLASLGYRELRRLNARLNGNDPDFDPDIARELLVPFIADSGVVEICFCGGSEMVLSPGSWGLDNVVIDRTPTNPGVVGGGGGAQIALGGDGALGGGSAGHSYPQGNPYDRNAPFKGTPGSGGGGGNRTPFDFSDFFDPPDPEDPPFDDPPEDDPPFDPPPPPEPPDGPDPPDDPPVPAPGTLFLGPLLALGAARRRRR